MQYAVGTDPGGMIYIPSFVRVRTGIQKLMRDTQTHRYRGDRISLLVFFQNKESRLKRIEVV
jgi:hypothetical protein